MAMDEEDLAKLFGKGPGDTLSVSGPYGSIGVPTFNFIGRLPEVYQAGRNQRTREATLASLEPGTNLLDPIQANKVALRLFNEGDWAGGNRILAAAQKAEELRLSGLSAAALSKFIEKYGPTGVGVQPTAGDTKAAAEQPIPQLPQGAPSAAPAAAPAAPQYPWPTYAPGRVEPTPGPQGALSPSDELIGRAQVGLVGGGGTPAPVQLAQAGGGLPPVGGAGAPPTGLPDWVGGAQAPVARMPQAPTEPQVSPEDQFVEQFLSQRKPGAQLTLPRLTVTPGADPTAVRDLQQINRQILDAAAGSKASPLLTATMSAQLRNVLARLYPDQKRRDYEYQMYQRAVAGEPVISMEKWEQQNKLIGDTYKGAMKEADRYIIDTEKSRGLIQNMEIAKSIMKNPAFASGGAIGGEAFQRAQATVLGIRDYFRSQGVDENNLPSLESMRTTAGLQQAFNGLMSNSLLYKVTSFGPGFSNIDLKKTEAIFPALGDTPEANMLKAELLIASEKNKLGINRIVSGYMDRRGTDASPYELSRLVDDYTRTHSPITDAKGNPTKLGKELIDYVTRPGGKPPPTTIEDYIKQDIVPPSMLPAARDLYNRITTPPPQPTESKTRGPYPPEDEGRMGTTPDGQRWIIRNGHPERMLAPPSGGEPTRITVPLQPGRG